MEKELLQPVTLILDEFLSSQDFGDQEINQTFRETAKEVFPEALIAIFAASHLECSGQSLVEATSDDRVRRFLHGLLFATFGLHNLEILVEFEKQATPQTKLRKSLSLCTGGLCLAKASLILKDEDQRVLDGVYGLISVSALAELKRRRAIGRFDISSEEYLRLCLELSSPLKLFVAGPMLRCAESSSQLEKFLRFVECFDVSNRLTKELNVCFGLQGSLAEELGSEQPPLLLQLGAKDPAMERVVARLLASPYVPNKVLGEMRQVLLSGGYVDRVRGLIELHLSEGSALSQGARDRNSRSIMQSLIQHVQETYEFNCIHHYRI